MTSEQVINASLNTWTTAFLLVVVAGLYISYLLLKSKKTRSQNFPIAILVIGCSLIILQYVFHWSKHNQIYHFLYFFDHSIYLLIGPLIYTYVVKFFDNRYKIQYLHFFPFVLSFLIHTYYYDVASGSTPYSTYKSDALIYYFGVLRSAWVAAISFLIYFLVTVEFVRFHKKTKPSQFEKVRAKWVKVLLKLFALFIIAYLSYFVLVRFSFFNNSWDYAISLTMSIAINGIGYFVYKEPEIFNGELLTQLFANGKATPTLSEKTKHEFYSKLLAHIESNKPYLNNNLRLVKLADDLGLSRHILSKIINEKAQTNFNQFINEFRLNDAEKLLSKNTNDSIKSIYYDVGFNNKASFYKAFKNRHQCTPLEYRQRMINNS